MIRKVPTLALAFLGIAVMMLPPRAGSAGFDMAGSANGQEAQQEFVAGFGRDWPVGLVVQEVVPKRYDVLFAPSVDRQETTSWQGGRPWQEVLDDALAPLNLGFKVRAQDSTVIVEPQSRSPAARERGAARGGATHRLPPEGAREWEAQAGQTLRDVLNGWGDEAGWAIAWESERDYRLEASASFFGDFETAATNLLRAFAVAEPPVRGTIYRGNRVLVVTSGVDRGQ